MKRLILMAVASLFVACSPSDVDPNADVVIGGTVATATGDPVAGAEVALSKEADVVEGLFTVSSLGLACLMEEVEAACGDTDVVRSGNDGRFAFSLKGRDTQTTLGTAATMDVAATREPVDDELGGPSAVQRFQAQTERIDLPIRLWRPDLRFGDDRRLARVRWSDPGRALPDGADPSEVRYDVVFRQGGRSVWVLPGWRTGKTFDARVLEDTAGSVAVSADVDDISVPVERGSGVDLLLTSQRVGYRARSGIPDSRGRPCVSNSAGRPVTHSPCDLTDGEFAEPFEAPACDADRCPDASAPEWVYVDMGKPTDVALVVARGCSSGCRVESSMDARSWSPVAVGSPAASGRDVERDDLFAEAVEDVAVKPSRPTQARYVRVLPKNGVDRLREVSVFDPKLPPEPRNQVGGAGAPGAASSSGWLRWVLASVAIALGVIAVILIRRSTALGSRRPI